jgi:hypothetical protein
LADDVTINVPGSGIVAAAPKEFFEGLIQEIAEEIIEEASKIEYADRANTSTEVQYTTRHFKRAVQVVRERGNNPARRPRWYLLTDIGSPIMFLLAGACFGLIPGGWGWSFPAAAFTAAAGILVATKAINEHHEGR